MSLLTMISMMSIQVVSWLFKLMLIVIVITSIIWSDGEWGWAGALLATGLGENHWISSALINTLSIASPRFKSTVNFLLCFLSNSHYILLIFIDCFLEVISDFISKFYSLLFQLIIIFEKCPIILLNFISSHLI